MIDRNGIIEQIEDKLGFEGSLQLAEALLPLLLEDKWISFDAHFGYAFVRPEDWPNDDGQAWNEYVAEAELSLGKALEVL